jgi:multidrug resistance protein MdtO
MATAALPAARGRSPLAWLHDFLRDELAPYPGRGAIVIRVVTATTVIMIICETFRIPYGWQAAIYAVFVSRESFQTTLRTLALILVVTGIGATYVLVSMSLVASFPVLHFLWIIISLFLAFFLISTLTEYIAAVAYANLIAAAIPLWDRTRPAETNVENTLWLCLAVFVSVAVTSVVELVFSKLRPEDEVVALVDDRLAAIEELLNCYAQGRPADPAIEQNINHFEMLGTSLLRRSLWRSSHSPRYAILGGAVAALVGRLVDLAAALMHVDFESSANDRKRFQDLALAIGTIRKALLKPEIRAQVQFHLAAVYTQVPLLGAMEHTVTQIAEAFAGSSPTPEYVQSADDLQRRTLLAPDAFTNREHIRFAARGCLAASTCYIVYNAVDWQGISTAVTTCMLTALSTIGSSRQKQILRVIGAAVGGFVLGMGSQVFILPYVDSIAGFTLLFIVVTALTSWVATSSPRLSYAGVQMALAFYLIHLEEFKIRTSLAVARDRVAGIFLGLFAMWLVFDQLWSAPAAVEMKRTFVSNLRLLAQFTREPLSQDRQIALARNLAFRETINTSLDKVRALSDGVLLEFGPSRDQNLALRDRIRQWQPDLRMLFLQRIVLWRYRIPLPGFELPQAVSLAQRDFDEELASTLDSMADRIEHKPAAQGEPALERSFKHLEETVQSFSRKELPQAHPARLQTFLALSRRSEELATSLDKKIESRA